MSEAAQAEIGRLKAERDRLQAWFKEAEGHRDYWKHREKKRTAALEAERDRLQERIAFERKTNAQQREALDTENARLREALERDAAVLDKVQATMRKHGFKFEAPLHLSKGMEKWAFTFYTFICEVDSNAREALEGTGDE